MSVQYVEERIPATSQLCSIMETAGKPWHHCDDPDTEERVNQNGDGKIDWKGHCTVWTFSYVNRIWQEFDKFVSQLLIIMKP